jgi:hypothetical protein
MGSMGNLLFTGYPLIHIDPQKPKLHDLTGFRAAFAKM